MLIIPALSRILTRNALNISAIGKPDYSAIAKDVNNDNSSLLNSEAYSRQY